MDYDEVIAGSFGPQRPGKMNAFAKQQALSFTTVRFLAALGMTEGT